jgi:hypothetical protein
MRDVLVERGPRAELVQIQVLKHAISQLVV